MKTLVSVITPVYNCERYIERCINSLLNQTCKEIEIIMIDDGSRDNSAEIIKDYQKKYENIRYIYQENSGPGVARNRAIRQAVGKYILFVDSDDYVSEDYIEELVETAEKNESELVITGYTLVYENDRKEKIVVPKFYESKKAEEWAYRISACCSRMYSREFWLRNQINFSEERDARAEDVPIVLLTNVIAKNIAIVKKAGYYYFQHSESAMNNKKKKVVFEFPYKAFKAMYEQVCLNEKQNSEIYFQVGVLKFLAQFDLVIYRKAGKKEKEKYKNYLKEIIGKDFGKMSKNWKKLKCKMDLPITHKIAIDIFVIKCKMEFFK